MAWIEQPNNKATILETWMTPTKKAPKKQITADDLQKKIAALEKQLQWEKLRADALDTLINVAEDKLNISIRKKSGSPQSGK
ncbi:MAG: hypothetical protein IPP02_09485 [Chitinophagaceae bacterium]|nr:hypothetical protein [Chitinophagaceae bacterium]